MAYFRAIGYFFCIAMTVLLILLALSAVMTNYWLSLWSDDAKTEHPAFNFSNDSGILTLRISVYIGLGLSQGDPLICHIIVISLLISLNGLNFQAAEILEFLKQSDIRNIGKKRKLKWY